MKVLIYHPVLMPVVRYGGSERVLLWLAKELKRQGHTVAVHAAPGSQMPEGIECLTDPIELMKRAGEFDLLHGFTKPAVEVYEAFQNKVLVSIHGNGQRGEKFHRNTLFVSRNHAERHGATEFVHNGIDLSELKFDESTRPDRFLFLSKTSWKVKNLAGAARMVSQARKNLWIAGGERPYGLRAMTYFKRLLGHDWKWLGSINQAEKAHFLVSGKAMIFPILWNEPFGLVMVEALASGTPVFANPYGSVPEVLEFAPQCIMNSEEDWMRTLSGKVTAPSPQRCREWVIEKFSAEVMTKKYVGYYERVANGEFLHDKEPVTLKTAEEIL